MATGSRVLLSASTNGRGIKVAATSTPGTTIHTSVASITQWDEVWLRACNTDTSQRRLTIEFGGTTSPDDTFIFDIPPKFTMLIVDGWNINNAAVVKAFADSANLVTIIGYVNRIA